MRSQRSDHGDLRRPKGTSQASAAFRKLVEPAIRKAKTQTRIAEVSCKK